MLAQIDVAQVAITLLGGLSLFLFGMVQMTDALKAAAGDRMRTLLGTLTRNRFLGAMTGAFVTAVIQSSSVTTVLVVGFVTAGLMSLTQSIGVIMGANVGTTITAQVIAFKVTQYALLMVAVGFGGMFLSTRETVRRLGRIVFGLGLIFLGMNLMSEAAIPLRDYGPFRDLLATLSSPWLAAAAGAAFTALVQASAATTGIVIALATQGLLPLEQAIAVVIGSNIGTCVTAMLATIGKPAPALRVGLVHVAFNVIGALIWLPFVDVLADLARGVSPGGAPGLEMTAATPRQIANAHTIFNIVNAVAMIGAVGWLAALVTRLVPERGVPADDRAVPRFLDEALIDTPALAIDGLRREIARLGEIARAAFARTTPAPTPFPLAEIGRLGRDAKVLHEQILGYAQRVLREDLRESDVRRLVRVLDASHDFAAIADVLRLNLQALAREWQARDLRIGAETGRRLDDLHSLVAGSIEDAIVAVRDEDPSAARRVIERKLRIVEAADHLSVHLARRLSSADPQRLAIYRLEMSSIELFKRIFYFAKRTAKAAMESSELEPEALARAIGSLPAAGSKSDPDRDVDPT